MFGWFKKTSDNKKKEASADAVDISHLSDAKQKLMAQMRQVRAEIGEEEIKKMQAALQHEALKKQIRKDIETDDEKRQRLIDEIRNGLKE